MCEHCGCSPTPVHDHAHDHAHAHGLPHDHQHDHDHAHTHDHAPAAPGGRTVDVRTSILAHNDRLAEQNRGFFRAKGLFVVNLLSAPGAGKTALIERTLKDNADLARRMAVIVGDLQTENDADRIRAAGGNAVQITTGEVCHLDAHMVQHALEHLPLQDTEILLVENVGNLVCPASFDLGEHRRVVLMSVTEGEDKPLKYPVIFNKADLVLLTKIDLAAAVDFDADRARANIARVAPRADILSLSAKTGEGLAAWFAWLNLAGNVPR